MKSSQVGAAGARAGHLKTVGLLACSVVVGQLLLFAVGEGVDGVGHLVQATPLLLLMLLAWWRPLIGGALIVLAAIGLATAYVVGVGEPQPLVLILFFAPAILGGLSLVGAGLLEPTPRR
jgi:hypothetical protein